MDETVETRRKSSRNRRLSSMLRRVNFDGFSLGSLDDIRGIGVTRRTRPDGSDRIYLRLTMEGRSEKWILLDCHPDDPDTAVVATAGKALERFRKLKRRGPLPIATGERKTVLMKALEQVDEASNSVKHTQRRKRWLRETIEWLEDHNLSGTQEDLTSWIRSHPLESRARRDATSAARQLYKISTLGKRLLEVSDRDQYIEPMPAKDEPLDPERVLAIIMKIWDESEEGSLEEAVAYLLSWSAGTGARGSMIMSSLLMHIPEQVKIEVGEWISCRDNKRGRNREARFTLSNKELIAAVGVERLRKTPLRLKAAACPWDRAANREEQHRMTSELGRISNWLWRKLTDEDRKIIDLRQLRRMATDRLLTAGIDLLLISEALSTSEKQLRERYSSHARFRAADAIKQALG